MPKQVDHHERRESIAHALWRVVTSTAGHERPCAKSPAKPESHWGSYSTTSCHARRCWPSRWSLRRTDISPSRRSLRSLDQPPHPREVLRVVLTEMLPLQPDARATSRMNAAYVLEAMHDPTLRRQVGIGLRDGRAMVERLIRQAMNEGQIRRDRDPMIETDLVLALTGFAALSNSTLSNRRRHSQPLTSTSIDSSDPRHDRRRCRLRREPTRAQRRVVTRAPRDAVSTRRVTLGQVVTMSSLSAHGQPE